MSEQVFVALTSIFVGIALVITSALDMIRANQYSNELKEALQTDDKNEMNVLGLMRTNLESIKGFYTWTQIHAILSFVFAVAMCGLGVFLIYWSIQLSIQQENASAVIPAIGGVIFELLSGVVLMVYRSSLDQMNYYHKSLHEDERILSGVNLAERFLEGVNFGYSAPSARSFSTTVTEK